MSFRSLFFLYHRKPGSTETNSDFFRAMSVFIPSISPDGSRSQNRPFRPKRVHSGLLIGSSQLTWSQCHRYICWQRQRRRREKTSGETNAPPFGNQRGRRRRQISSPLYLPYFKLSRERRLVSNCLRGGMKTNYSEMMLGTLQYIIIQTLYVRTVAECPVRFTVRFGERGRGNW